MKVNSQSRHNISSVRRIRGRADNDSGLPDLALDKLGRANARQVKLQQDRERRKRQFEREDY